MYRLIFTFFLIVGFLGITLEITEAKTPSATERTYLTALGNDAYTLFNSVNATRTSLEYYVENDELLEGYDPVDVFTTVNNIYEKWDGTKAPKVPASFATLNRQWMDVLEPIGIGYLSSLEYLQDEGPMPSKSMYERETEAENDFMLEVFSDIQYTLKQYDIKPTVKLDKVTATSFGADETVANTTNGSTSITLTGNDVSRDFYLAEGNYRATIRCTGSSYGTFVTLESAPGSDGYTFEILAFGESTPLASNTTLINIYSGGDVVLVQEVIGEEGTVTCHVEIE